MGKGKDKGSSDRPGKGKKLDLIAADVRKIRDELKKLLKQQSDLAKAIGKLAVVKPTKTSAPAKPKANPAPADKARKPSAKPAKPVSAPARPVLVQSADPAIPAARPGT